MLNELNNLSPVTCYRDLLQVKETLGPISKPLSRIRAQRDVSNGRRHRSSDPGKKLISLLGALSSLNTILSNDFIANTLFSIKITHL